jgi:hypothetical protein
MTIHRCGHTGKRAIHQLLPDENKYVPTENHIWDSRKWGSKPFLEYLPQDATAEDFFKAKAWEEAGYDLRPQMPVEGDYAESDFGDDDSTYSVHDWSDDEDGATIVEHAARRRGLGHK